MSKYLATIKWSSQAGDDFVKNEFSRHHLWEFDGGLTVPASATPNIVPLPYSVAENIDPEEAFVASLASCHMLWFLAIAAKKLYEVDWYVDPAWGVMDKNDEGKMAMTKVVLCPEVVFTGDNLPSDEEVEKMHHTAHENCFIANSVKTEVVIEIGGELS